eukprot:3916298-Pyramimonas_sp.AAC.1
MREEPGPPRARRPWLFCVGECTVRAAALAHIVWEHISCARGQWGQGRCVRGGPGPFWMRKCMVRAAALASLRWNISHARRARAAARAAALARSALENVS